jgi:hypothetical protein
MCLAGEGGVGGGGLEGGPACMGWPRIKRSLLFYLFSGSQNHIEKLPKGGLDIF